VKDLVVAELRSAGWEVEFSRLRLRWYRGVVMDHLHLRRAGTTIGPQLFADGAEFSISHAALRDLRIVPTGLQIQGGRLVWEWPGTNRPPATLDIQEIATELKFGSDDTWTLASLKGRFLDCRVSLDGVLTNASAVRDWEFAGSTRTGSTTSAELWRRLMEIETSVRKMPSPLVMGRFTGDAARRHSFNATLQAFVPGFESPWGHASNVVLNVALLPAAADSAPIPLRLDFNAESAVTEWAVATNVSLRASMLASLQSSQFSSVTATLNSPLAITPWAEAAAVRVEVTAPVLQPNGLPTNTVVTIDAGEARTTWIAGQRLRSEIEIQPCPTNAAWRQTVCRLKMTDLRCDWLHALEARLTLAAEHPGTRFLPANLDVSAHLSGAQTHWGQVGAAGVVSRANLPSVGEFRLGDTNLVLPDQLSNVVFTASLGLTNIVTPRLRFTNALAQTRWRFPKAEANVDAVLTTGRIAVTANTDTAVGGTVFHGDGQLDPIELAPLFSTNARRWIADFRWSPPPTLRFDGRCRLPAWSKRDPGWQTNLFPTLELAGRLAAGESAFQGVAVRQAKAGFSLTNEFWRVTDFTLTRPEGNLVLDGEFDQRGGHFEVRMDNGINLLDARSLVQVPKAQKVFDFFQFSEPPAIRARVAGSARDWTTLHGQVEVALTNLAFRGETIGVCTARAHYTNQFVSIFDPVIRRPGEHATADGIGIDVRQELLYLTNAYGTIDPYALTRAIGPKTYQAIAAYQFARPPTGRVWGRIDLRGRSHRDDAHFDIMGESFQWQVFHLDRLAGQVHWRGQTVTLTNLDGRWREGDVLGWVYVDDTPKGGSEVRFFTTVTNVNLNRIMTDIKGQASPLEGRLSGELAADYLFTTDWDSWDGHGRARLEDGYLWSLPVFGIFTPTLDRIMPGLGSSRFKEATADFTMTKSVLYTRNFEARAAVLRMLYQGSVDFHQRIEGRIEAELLRDLPGIGFLVRTVLLPISKIFIYKVTGTLNDPQTEPLYVIPKLLSVPMLPFKAIRDIFTDDEKKEKQTNEIK
jgi:hypothetical protein